MFTAKIISKTKEEGIIALTVEFTDGVSTYTEVVKPQDEDGLKYWLEARIKSLETSKQLETADNIGKPIVFIEKEVLPETPEQIYYNSRWKLLEHKQDLDLGLITQEEYDTELSKVLALKPKIKK